MRITFVITNGPTLKGGLEHVCLRLAQHLGGGAEGNRIACRFTQARHSLGGYFLDHEPCGVAHHEGVPIHVLTPGLWGRQVLRPVFRLSWRPATHPLALRLYHHAMLPGLLEVCRGSDLVHYLGSARELLGFAAHAAATKLGIPFVVEPAVHPGQWGDSWSDGILYRLADRVLAHSKHEEEVLVRMGVNSDRAVTVTHGVDIGVGGDKDRFRVQHGVGGPMILFLGRKTEEKGVRRCLEAFQLVRSQFPTATLVLAGPSAGKILIPDRPGVLDLDDLSEAGKQDALAACDLLCVPSAGESFGMVYFEAWAYAKPVVALDLPTLRETVGAHNGGLLTSPKVGDIADAISKLLQDGELSSELGENGNAAAKRHEWRRAAISYERVLGPLWPAKSSNPLKP